MASPESNAQFDLHDHVQDRTTTGQRSDGRLPLVPIERLTFSPSRADGISAEEETRLRSTACSFIARAGKELQLSGTVCFPT